MNSTILETFEVLIVLGSPNSSSGELSDISKSRLHYCLSCYEKGKLVLCTGGWGAHFNTAPKSHAMYAKDFLTQKGIREEDFLDFALSSNTVEDAVKVKGILEKLRNNTVKVITSDYHLERVQLIFNEILTGYTMAFIGVESNIDETEYQNLVHHEKNAINSINKNGLYY
jgi:uncharacterized SAM-binding protein YcdF (DUF218 family)